MTCGISSVSKYQKDRPVAVTTWSSFQPAEFVHKPWISLRDDPTLQELAANSSKGGGSELISLGTDATGMICQKWSLRRVFDCPDAENHQFWHSCSGKGKGKGSYWNMQMMWEMMGFLDLQAAHQRFERKPETGRTTSKLERKLCILIWLIYIYIYIMIIITPINPVP